MVNTWKVLLALALQMSPAHPQRAVLVSELTTRMAEAHRAEHDRQRTRASGRCCCDRCC